MPASGSETVITTLTIQELDTFDVSKDQAIDNMLSDLSRGLFLPGLGVVVNAERVSTDRSVPVADNYGNSTDASTIVVNNLRANVSLKLTCASRV